jgi:hypothetical protein
VDSFAFSENSTSVGYANNFSYGIAFALNNSSIGYFNNTYGTTSTAVGALNVAGGNNSSAYGYQVSTFQENTAEFGFWPNATTRGGSIRTSSGGMAAITTASGLVPFNDGGGIPGGEPAGTLPRGSLAFRTNNERLFLDTNSSSGVIKTREINATYRGQCSLNAPNTITFTGTGYGILTGSTTFDSNVAYGTSGTGFIITNTSGENRVFNVTAQVEIEKTTSGTIDYGIKLVKITSPSNIPLNETEVQENSSLNNPAYLTTTWMVGLNDQESVAIAIASVSGTGPATVNRARLTMFAV